MPNPQVPGNAESPSTRKLGIKLPRLGTRCSGRGRATGSCGHGTCAPCRAARYPNPQLPGNRVPKCLDLVPGNRAWDMRTMLPREVLFFFFTLVTGPRRSLSLTLSDTRVKIRARLGTIAHFCRVVVLEWTGLRDGVLRAWDMRSMQQREVPESPTTRISKVLNLRTTTSQKCAVVPRRARI